MPYYRGKMAFLPTQIGNYAKNNLKITQNSSKTHRRKIIEF